MVLKEIEIFNFKSIREERVIIQNNQVCFVGINESGKTSIIEAISYLNFLKQFDRKLLNKSAENYPTGYPVLSGVFELSTNDLEFLLNYLNPIIEKELAEAITIDNGYLQIKRWGNGFENIGFAIKSNSTLIDLLSLVKNKAEFLDYFLNSIYPIIEYFEEEELLIEPTTVDDLLGSEAKFESFRRLLFIGGCENLRILNDNDNDFIGNYLHDISENINQIFNRHYKQDEQIRISITPNFNSTITLSIRDSTNKSFNITERSPGFQYYFAFLVNKIYSNKIHEKRTIIYLLDEPGNNLHPKGAKDLLQTFNEVSKKNQIFFTTHNPFLALRNNLDSLVFVQKDSKKGTKINKKPYLNKYQILRKELGILLNDSFLIGDLNLIVEGNTEKLALHRMFNEEFEDLQWLNIYNADGVTNVSQALNYLGKNNLDLSGLVLFDSDEEAKNEKTRKGYIDAMKLSNWNSIEINDVFGNDGKERTFEDLFPVSIYISAFNDYCESLKDIGVFDKDYQTYTFQKLPEPPIIKELSKHFYSFINDDRKKQNSITKQDVIRLLLDKIDKLDKTEKKNALETPLRLVKRIKEKIKIIIDGGK